MKLQRIHFIAIGGSVMANLAIALKKEGHTVSGSDDKIYNPSKARLKDKNLLPEHFGWFPEYLDDSIDSIILGMHAKKDNPELIKAQHLGIPIYSFPDYIFNQSKDKQRIVIGGSHGKTTITALIIHTLLYHQRKFDYVVGAATEGIENTVQLTDAPIIVIEGDEYPSSCLDSTPKFIKYQHHIGVISGVEWDHANIFPSMEKYIEPFTIFADATPKAGVLIYHAEDPISSRIGKIDRVDVSAIPYEASAYTVGHEGVFIEAKGLPPVPIQLLGLHNIQNIAAAQKVLEQIGITTPAFYEALPHFKGAAGRLNLVFENDSIAVYRDFAHSPSKVRASTRAIKNRYPNRALVGCIELHTLSNLNKDFLPEYRDSMTACSTAIVYYASNSVNAFTEVDIQNAFNNDKLKVFTNHLALADYITSMEWTEKNLLMMSSGHFNALNMEEIIQKISTQKNQSIV